MILKIISIIIIISATSILLIRKDKNNSFLKARNLFAVGAIMLAATALVISWLCL